MSVRLEKMGECILRLREERGYSLEELAGLTLSSPDELRKIESGTQQPDKMTLTLLSNVLNVYLTVCRTERFITVLHNPI